jgi:hypothetical protein
VNGFAPGALALDAGAEDAGAAVDGPGAVDPAAWAMVCARSSRSGIQARTTEDAANNLRLSILIEPRSTLPGI